MKRLVIVIVVFTALLIAAGTALSSRYPDGLERVAATLGFASRGAVGVGSPFANYETRFFHSRWPAQASAGLLGVVLVYGFGVLFGRSLKRRKHAPRNPG